MIVVYTVCINQYLNAFVVYFILLFQNRPIVFWWKCYTTLYRPCLTHSPQKPEEEEEEGWGGGGDLLLVTGTELLGGGGRIHDLDIHKMIFCDYFSSHRNRQ